MLVDKTKDHVIKLNRIFNNTGVLILPKSSLRYKISCTNIKRQLFQRLNLSLLTASPTFFPCFIPPVAANE